MKTLNYIALVFACCLAFSCNNVSRDVKEFVITDYSFTDWKHLLEIEKVVQLSENDSCLRVIGTGTLVHSLGSMDLSL